MTNSGARICIIGAGQLGSRHLQALHAVKQPLNIHVIDPSAQSLAVAKERFDSLGEPGVKKTVTYGHAIESVAGPIDVGIIATSSNVRRKVVEKLLAATPVKALILEKLLFQHEEDYPAVASLLKSNDVRAWINCSMRTMPFYAGLKEKFKGQRVHFEANGSQFGLVTNAIHFLDYIYYLTGCDAFTLDTSLLDPTPIPSKRTGFLELNGTLRAAFADGSTASFTCYPAGTAPILFGLFGETYRSLSRDTERKAWVASAAEQWAWQEIEADIPFQSTMTTAVIENILRDGTCPLVPYDDSVRIHLPLLNGLRDFLNGHGQKTDHYPFT